MKFTEDSRVKIPGILHLVRLGYQYLSLKNAVWDEETNIFPNIFENLLPALILASNLMTLADCWRT